MYARYLGNLADSAIVLVIAVAMYSKSTKFAMGLEKLADRGVEALIKNTDLTCPRHYILDRILHRDDLRAGAAPFEDLVHQRLHAGALAGVSRASEQHQARAAQQHLDDCGDLRRVVAQVVELAIGLGVQRRSAVPWK